VKGLIAFFHACEEWLIVILFMGMVAVSFSQVVARYIFGSGWISALELTVIGFAWFILLGISYTLRTSSHLGVDIFVRMLPTRLFRILAIFASCTGVFYGLLLLDGGWLNSILGGEYVRGGSIHYVETMYRVGLTTEDLGWPRWIVYIMMPCSLLLFSWRCFWCGVEIFRGERKSMIGSHDGVRDMSEEKT
jgi:C4-dicarboxylate transporter DctQ subunit